MSPISLSALSFDGDLSPARLDDGPARNTKRSRRYFAVWNIYGSPSDVGFINTWRMGVFDNKKDRDAFVQSCNGRGDRAVTMREGLELLNARNDAPMLAPFTGKRWMIDAAPAESTADIPGYIGEVYGGDIGDYGAIPLYNR